MKNLITNEVKRVAIEKSKFMDLGTYSRLKVNGEITDVVISPSSSGIYFYNTPCAITKDISKQLICFEYYKDLNRI